MVVVMKQDATDSDIELVCEKVRNAGGEAFVSRGTVHTVVGLVGDTARFQAIPFTQLHGVDHVIQIGKPYKMVARDLHPEATTVHVGYDAGGPRNVHDHRGAVRGGVRGAGDDRHQGGEGGRRHDPAWRRLQAADLAVLVPGAGGARARDPDRVPPRRPACRSSSRWSTCRRWRTSPRSPTASGWARGTRRTSSC